MGRKIRAINEFQNEWLWMEIENKKTIRTEKKCQGSNVYLQAVLAEGSGAWGWTPLCFSNTVSFLGRICKSECFGPGYIHWVNPLSLLERDGWRGLTFEDNERRKIILNPAHQCTAQGFIKVFLLKKRYSTSTGKQKIRQNHKKRKAVIIKRHFNLKYINKCTMNSQ